MTRKHFEAIAAIIKQQRNEIVEDGGTANDLNILRSTAIRLAAEFGEQNAYFDSHRFLTACGF